MKLILEDRQDRHHEIEDFIFAAYSRVGRNCLKYTRKSDEPLRLPLIDGEILKIILHWMRCPSDLPLDSYQDFVVCDLLVASDFLDIPTLTAYIISWLEKGLNLENAIDLANFAKNFFIWDLESVCRTFIVENLDKFKTDQLKTLDREVLISSLMSDDLTLREERVWRIVQDLVQTEEDHLTDLMKCVRFDILEEDFWINEVYQTVEFHRYFKENFPLALDSPALVKKLYCSGMNQRSPNNLVFNFGGFFTEPISSISVFDPRRGFIDLPVSLPFTLAYSGAVVDQSEIFVVGGWRENQGPSSSLIKFNLEDWTLTTLSSMREPRNYVSVTKVDNFIYAIGGNTGLRRLRTVERYDVTKNQWYDCGEMKEVRSDAGVAVLNGLIYVIGGFNGHAQHSSVEIFDPEKGEWRMGKPLLQARSGVKVTEMDGKLYVVGGWSGGSERLSCGEVFDPKTNKWTKLPRMNVPRSNYSLVVADGQLMVAGGYDGSGLTQSTEILDQKNKTWVFGQSMMEARSGVASCSVSVREMKPDVRKRYRDIFSPAPQS